MHIFKINNLLAALCLCAVVLVSCNDRKEVEALKAETMRIHDEAMKDMGPLNAMARNIKKELAALDSLAPQRDSLLQVASKLESAETEMMDWMKNYKDPADDMPKEAAVKYLQEQKTAIEKNLKNIQAAIGKK